MNKPAWKRSVLLLLLLPPLWLVTACAPPPLQLQPEPAKTARVPALTQEARQPPVPPICSPTCSDGWRSLVDSSRERLTAGASPASPASAPTTP